jgi:hypothetical protein
MKALTGTMLVLTIATAGAAQKPDHISANDLLPACKAMIEDQIDFQNLMDIQFCAGMLTALGTLGQLRLMIGNTGTVCVEVPSGVTIGHMARVVVRYIEAHPKLMHEPFAQLAVEAVYATWPCKP